MNVYSIFWNQIKRNPYKTCGKKYFLKDWEILKLIWLFSSQRPIIGSVCVFLMCWFIELLLVNILSQKEHGNFFPKCRESLWALRFAFLEKFLPQSTHGNTSTGPLCFSFLWPNKDLLDVNSFPQSWHTSLSMLPCTSLLCCSIMEDTT